MARHVAALVSFLFLVQLGWSDEPKALANSLREFVRQNTTHHAVGLYIQGKKVGWMTSESKLGRHAGKEIAIETTEMLLAISSDGEKTEIKQNSVTHFSLDGDGSIIFAEERNTNDGQETVHTAIPSKGGLKVTTIVRGKKPITTERQVPLPKATLAENQKLTRWLLGTPTIGSTMDHHGISWEEQDVNQKETFKYLGRKKILWGGVQTDVFVVQIDMQGAKFDAEILANGNPLRGKIGALIELRAETEALAKILDAGNVDMLAASSIKVDRPLGDAKHVTRLTLEIAGVMDLTLPETHRQKMRVEKGKILLELRTDFAIDKAQPLNDAERKKFMEASPTIQSDQEAIRKQAAKVVGKETDPLKKAELLKSWVYGNLRKTMACNASTALAVLENKAGDCTEHTLLFVSLARAAGLPAREITGVAYVTPIFGWHAWAEIHDGKQWVSVDPTWNELYVDATHIVFSHDPLNHAWLNVLGSVSFKVIDITKVEP